MNLKSLSVIGFILIVAALVGLVVQKSILATGPVGIAVQVLAVALMIWARVTLGRRSFHASAEPTEGGLVTSGPYRWFRHPIYAAIFYFFWAAALSHISAYNILFAIIATDGIIIRIMAEERLLVERYPEYAAYAARTKRIIPFIL